MKLYPLSAKLRYVRQAHKGFTLIELLVVIAIIALLAAILFPVFARARENARKSSCANNLKQIAVGVAQYTQDFDEAYPLAWGGTSSGNYCWWQLLVPYIKSQQLFSCPSDSSKINGGNGFATAGTAQGYPSGLFHISYNVNYSLFYNGSYGAGYFNAPFNMADMPQPAGTVMMADSGFTAGTATSSPVPWLASYSTSKASAWLLVDPTCNATANTQKPCNAGTVTNSGDTNWSAPNPRHLDTVNVSFADGHVKALRPEAFYYQDSKWLNPKVGGS